MGELLSLQASIVEAALPHETISKHRCAPAYIQKISLQGAWVRDGEMNYMKDEEMGHNANETLRKVSEIQVRANPWLPEEQALEVGFDNGWQKKCTKKAKKCAKKAKKERKEMQKERKKDKEKRSEKR